MKKLGEGKGRRVRDRREGKEERGRVRSEAVGRWVPITANVAVWGGRESSV